MDGRLVLVVDDDSMLREVVGRAIGDAGYRVLLAASGEEALTLASTLDGQLGLVVTDVRMPGMDGLTLALRLLRLRPGLPVVFMSGYTAHERSTFPGPMLAKPFTLDQLLAQIRHALGDGAPTPA